MILSGLAGIFVAVPYPTIIPGLVGLLIFLGLIFPLIPRQRLISILILTIVFCWFAWRCDRILQTFEQQSNTVLELSTVPKLRLTGRIADTGPLQNSDERTRMLVSDVSDLTQDPAIPIPGIFWLHLRLKDYDAPLPKIEPGQKIEFTGRFRPNHERWNFSSRRTFFQQATLGIVGQIQGDPSSLRPVLEPRKTTSWRTLTINARDHCVSWLESSLPTQHSARLRAFLFNDFSQIQRQESAALRRTGLLHLYAISGSHFAAFSLLLVGILRAFMAFRSAVVLTALLLFCYLAVLDFPVAAFRAWLMLMGVAVAWMRRRESDAPTGLVFAVFVLMVHNPFVIFQAGFLLSVLGTLGLMTAGPVLAQDFSDFGQSGDSSWKRSLRMALAASVAASIFVLPLQVYLFQTLHPLSILANIPGGFFSTWTLAASFLALITAPLGLGIGEGFMGSAALGLDLMTRMAVSLDQLQGLIWQPARPPLWLIFGVYGLVLAGLYFAPVASPEFLPKARARLLIRGALVIFVMGFISSFAESRRHLLTLTFFDVGQGDATLIELPGGGSLLVDGGNHYGIQGYPVIATELAAMGRRVRPTFLATHGDSDHVAGFLPLLRDISPLGIFEGCEGNENPLMAELRADADALGIPRALLQAGDILWENGPNFVRVIAPVDGCHPDPKLAGGNEDSVVLEIQMGGFRALLTGDATTRNERIWVDAGLLQPVTLLKAGHHGSKTSTGQLLLDTIQPQYAVISCGLRNQYGHPSAEVVERLEGAGAEVLRTDTMGAIRFTTDGSKVTVEKARPERLLSLLRWGITPPE
jgi:competence protein ComEC